MHTKVCKNCQQDYTITPQDESFYGKLKVPAPTHCPDCRLQRRLAWRNEKSLYKRKCDLCHKDIIAIFPADSKYKVYCQECWWGFSWEPMQYGRDFDFSRPFFEQFAELLKEVPFFSLLNQASSLENSEYVNHVTDAKNCYLVFAANYLEDCLYSSYIWECKDTLDSMFCTKVELCYFCLDCDNLYNCQYLQNSKNCSDCMLGYELRNCKNCFGCVNITNKEFHFFNEPLSKEEYSKRTSEILSDKENFPKIIEKFQQFSLQFPKRYAHQINCEKSTGDGIKNCQNCIECFDGYGGQDLKWMINFPGETKDCYDISGCAKTELSIECQGIFPGYDVKYSNGCLNNSTNVSYCVYLDGGKNLFGCVGTKKAEYCILNKKYSKEEYESLTQKIIEHMKKTGEYGEFFPIKNSPFAYNESIAHEHFPLTKEEALAKSYCWKEEEKHISNTLKTTTEILSCKTCNKNYKLVPKEIQFYKNQHLEIPKNCPTCRAKELRKLRNPRKLWPRQCAKCQKEIHSTFAPQRPEIVYCEECFFTTMN